MAILSSSHQACGQSRSGPSRGCRLHHYRRACTVCLALCVFFGVHLPSCHGHGNHGDHAAPLPDDHGGGLQPSQDPPSLVRQENTYVRSIFERYGDGETITFEAFEHLLENIGLGNLVIADHVLKDHFRGGEFNTIHKDHHHVDEHVDHDHNGHGHDEHVDHDHSGLPHSQSNDPYGDGHVHGSLHASDPDGSHDAEGPVDPVNHDGHNHTDHSSQAGSPHHTANHSLPQKPSDQDTSHARAEDVTLTDTNTSSSRSRRSTENTYEDQVLVSTESSEMSYEAVGLHQRRKLSSVRPTISTSTASMVQLPGYPEGNLNSADSSTHVKHRSGLVASHSNPHNPHRGHHDGDSYDSLRRSRQSRHLRKHHPLRHHSNKHGDGVTYRRTIRRADDSWVMSETSGSRSQVDHRPHRVRREASDINAKCLSVQEILEQFQLDTSSPIHQNDFLQLCPVLISQLDVHACGAAQDGPDNSSHAHSESQHGHHDHDHDHDHEHDDSVTYTETAMNAVPLKVWGFASLSVIIISLVGLVGVAMVPVMQKVFYNHLLQFLVALAVGSLTGDALLHLIPHALIPHGTSGHDHGSDTHHGDHKEGVWRGLVALSGVYFFFLMERIMGSITNWKRNKNKKKKRCNSSKLYPAEETDGGRIGAKLSQHEDHVASCELTTMMVHPDKDLRMMAEDAHGERHADCIPEDQTNIVHQHANNETAVEFKNGGQVHTHHGHSHEVPTSIAAVAWMVIMGDGLHNFSDGLAIGAAFADSLTGGLSTSVAVFCHELPHELGDFAVLLRAGMSVKQAIMYNMVSSVLCFVGMVVGIGVGNISSASLWIFALAGGMFIYIALVDMIPEMTAMNPKKGENPLVHHLLQHLGLLTGASIMLLIAIYEEDIRVPMPGEETP